MQPAVGTDMYTQELARGVTEAERPHHLPLAQIHSPFLLHRGGSACLGSHQSWRRCHRYKNAARPPPVGLDFRLELALEEVDGQ